MAYTQQITFLLFLKMADEQSKPPYNKTIDTITGPACRPILADTKNGASTSID